MVEYDTDGSGEMEFPEFVQMVPYHCLFPDPFCASSVLRTACRMYQSQMTEGRVNPMGKLMSYP